MKKIILLSLVVLISTHFLFKVIASEKSGIEIIQEVLTIIFGDYKDDILDKTKACKNILTSTVMTEEQKLYALEKLKCGIPAIPPGGEGGSEVKDIGPLIVQYGLPAPKLDKALEIKNKLAEANPWGVKALLAGEKKCGSSCLRYLTTAWIWSEVGWYGGTMHVPPFPDPYLHNCAGNQNIYEKCSTSNFQVGGYQAWRKKYKDVFLSLYKEEEEMKTVMQKVIDNSNNASKDSWSYIRSRDYYLVLKYLPDLKIQDSDTNYVINANPDGLSDEKEQFFSLIVGKDPAVAIKLNSAVSMGDLVGNCIKKVQSGGVCYGDPDYYSRDWVQNMSNLVAALWMFETGKNDLTPIEGGGDGSKPPDTEKLAQSVYYANQLSNIVQKSSACGNRYCSLPSSITNKGYSSTIRTPPKSCLCACFTMNVHGLVQGTITLPDGQKISEGAALQAAQMAKHYTSYLYFNAKSTSEKITMVSSLKPGCFMYSETVHGVQSGGQHASVIVNVNFNSTTGDGKIETLDFNAPKKGYPYTVTGGNIINNITDWPLISFACL